MAGLSQVQMNALWRGLITGTISIIGLSTLKYMGLIQMPGLIGTFLAIGVVITLSSFITVAIGI